jgi:hypothetical protein
MLSTTNWADDDCGLDPPRIDRTSGNVNELKGGWAVGDFAIWTVQFAVLACPRLLHPITEGSPAQQFAA